MCGLPTAIFLTGPTSAGKTGLAVELVRRFSAAIISVDSAMVYRGMDIGTAKPGQEVLAIAPHRMIDICDPVEPYSAAKFREQALVHMRDITAQGRIPLLVGGTMLYFRALKQGLSQLPAADPAFRLHIEAQAEKLGWKALHQRLMHVDPQSGQRIHPNDAQRIQRALEVYELTGRCLSELLQRGRDQLLSHRVINIVIAPHDRTLMHKRIDRRFHSMLERGLVDEVGLLFNRGDLHTSLPSMRAVGYRQVWQYLAGELAYNTMVEKAIVATRRFAKRQLTWLRAERDVVWFDSSDKNILTKILNYLTSVSISR